MLVALGLLALLAVVALGTRSDRDSQLADPSERAVPPAVFDYAFTIAGVAAVVAIVLAFRLVRRPSFEARRGSRSSMLRTLVAITIMAAVVAGAARLIKERRERDRADQAQLLERRGRVPTPQEAEPRRERRPEFKWEVAAIAGALALAGALAYSRLGRTRRGDHEAAQDGAVTDDLVVVLEEAIDDLEAEPDARRAVIAAYARMEATLAAHGLPRRSFEAPLEYLSRVLRNLQVGAAPLLALTELFERAKFSPHEIDTAMKAEALAAFVSVRDDLRSNEPQSAEQPSVVA